MLVLTERAAQVIKEIVDDGAAGPEGGLRITGSMDGNGDAGLEFALASAPEDSDEIVRDRGAVIFLDEAAATALADMTLDIEAHGDHFHFSLEEQGAAE